MESLFLDPGPENIFSKVQDEANRLFLLIEKAVLCDENVGLDAAELAAQNQAIRDFLAGRPAEFP
jgi:hypothetical protein